MVEVLPGILEHTFSGVAEKVSRLQGIVERVQLDVADGVFVPEKTWNEPDDLSKIESNMLFDIHLMVDRPEKVCEAWNISSVFRITFHFEATYDVRRTAGLVSSFGKKVGLALNPETPIESVYDVIDGIDVVLIMGVAPGAQGRAFDPKVVDKVRALREHDEHIAIGVDGGVTPIVSDTLISSGANMLVSGSYLFGCSDIMEGMKTLRGGREI